MFSLNFLTSLSQWRKHTPRLAIGLLLTALFAVQTLGLIPIKFIDQVDNIFCDSVAGTMLEKAHKEQLPVWRLFLLGLGVHDKMQHHRRQRGGREYQL
jgi:hypothetical protein